MTEESPAFRSLVGIGIRVLDRDAAGIQVIVVGVGVIRVVVEAANCPVEAVIKAEAGQSHFFGELPMRHLIVGCVDIKRAAVGVAAIVVPQRAVRRDCLQRHVVVNLPAQRAGQTPMVHVVFVWNIPTRVGRYPVIAIAGVRAIGNEPTVVANRQPDVLGGACSDQS